MYRWWIIIVDPLTEIPGRLNSPRQNSLPPRICYSYYYDREFWSLSRERHTYQPADKLLLEKCVKFAWFRVFCLKMLHVHSQCMGIMHHRLAQKRGIWWFSGGIGSSYFCLIIKQKAGWLVGMEREKRSSVNCLLRSWFTSSDDGDHKLSLGYQQCTFKRPFREGSENRRKIGRDFLPDWPAVPVFLLVLAQQKLKENGWGQFKHALYKSSNFILQDPRGIMHNKYRGRVMTSNKKGYEVAW